MQWFGALYVFLVGLCIGSFANATAWRIAKERDFIRERSQCDNCGHTLAWHDLIPVVSWLLLGGKCRYCHHKLSPQHVYFELGTGFVALLSFIVWPYGFGVVGLILFVIWLLMLTTLAIMWVYDWRWMLLPSAPNYAFGILGIIFGVVRGLSRYLPPTAIASDIILGIASIAGIYYAVYLLTAKRGVGEGDIILGIGIGAALGWQGGLGVLMLANVIGALCMLPAVLRKKANLKTAIPFGPFLMIGFYIMLLWGGDILQWYHTIVSSIY